MPHPPCPKCSGLLVHEFAHDWLSGQELSLAYCVNCGNRLEPQMSLNRTQPPAVPDGRTLPRMVGTSRYLVSGKKPGPPKGSLAMLATTQGARF